MLRLKSQLSLSLLYLLFLISNITAKNVNHKSWTFLTYIAGDNDLNKFINADISQMQTGANENTNVLAFVNTRANEKKVAQKLVITKDNIYQDGPDLPNLDSGIKESVIKAIDWAIENYPSDKLVLNFWDHGSGPLNKILQSIDIDENEHIDINFINEGRGVCYDYTTGNFLKDQDLFYICNYAKNKIGKKIDIVAFDACLMANIEIAYVIKDSASLLVSSQESIPGTGYNYTLVLNNLKENDLDPKQLAKNMVLNYQEAYKDLNNYYTLSAIDLEKINPLIKNINKVSKILTSYLETQKNHRVDKAVTFAGFTNKNIRFDEPGYIDLYNFYFNLLHYVNIMNLDNTSTIKIKKILSKGLNLIKSAVIENVAGPKFALVQGISIYLPTRIHHSYNQLYWSEETKWLTFLNTYIKARKQNW